jgi:MYXO-CTERM domain-containing protein
MRRIDRRLLGAVAVLALSGAGRPALGDWPVARRDVARTAYAPGTSAITQPTRYWQAYLGGTLSPSSHVALDIDGDGVVDLVYLAGGKAIAKHADDRVVWESTPLDFTRIEGAVDLDGDGALELVVSSGRNVFVLGGATGQVLWRSPDGEVGAVGAVRLADLDGDGRPEITIDECGCCGITPTANPPGGVYHFDAGALGTPVKLYAPLTRGHCGSSALTAGDFDGDGAADLAYGDGATLILTSGKTGAALATSDVLGENIYYASCLSANVDGRPGDEVICFQNTYLAAPATGGRRVFAVTYDASASPAARTLYDLAPVPKDVGQLQWVGNSLGDLDGDGQLEITVSWNDGAAWSTAVYDAATGAALATLPERLEGIVDVDGDKLPEILTTTSAGLVARRFQRAGSPALTQVATFPAGYHVKAQHDFAQAARGAVSGRPLALDLLGDGNVVPVFFVDAAGATPAAYVAARVASGAPATLATFQVPAGITILTNQVYANLNRKYPQLVLARNDGFLVFLDSAFQPTNGGTFGSPEFPEVLPGMRVGGFIGAPIAPRLGAAADTVVVTDSRGALVGLDAAQAWMSTAPAKSWELARAGSPSIAPKIDNGKPGLVCASNGAATLTALRADGTTIWAHDLPSGTLSGDPLAADVNGDGVSDVLAAHLTTGSVLNLQAYDGKTGTPLWPAPYVEAQQWGYYPFALADHDGDGALDMFVVSNTLRVLDGKTGATLAHNPSFVAYFTPTIQDVDGDGVPEVTLSRGYYPARTVRGDLTTTLWTGPDDRPYQHGARAACSGGRSVWVQPSTQTQGMLRLIDMNGATAGTTSTLFLAGGAAFADAASAAAAGKFLGALGDVVMKQDLVGTGAHPSALLGSSDGFLYALDPCGGTIDWVFDLKFAVGNPIFADPNGSGVDQILVPAADGYVHALQQLVLAAPAHVNDNAVSGSSVVVGPDLDSVETASTLAASWDAVPGADGYQVAALTEGNTYLTQPDWVSVGAVTSVAVQSLSLTPGKKYVFAVRAVSKTKGSSLETRSNGVVVVAPTLPDGGAGGSTWDDDAGSDAGGTPPDAGHGGAGGAGTGSSGGCGCTVAGDDAPAGAALAAALAMLAFAGRRRSAARRCAPRRSPKPPRSSP